MENNNRNGGNGNKTPVETLIDTLPHLRKGVLTRRTHVAECLIGGDIETALKGAREIQEIRVRIAEMELELARYTLRGSAMLHDQLQHALNWINRNPRNTAVAVAVP